MIEMQILHTAKETDNKLRWDAHLDHGKFALYIPKWRVPAPWPETIRVGVTNELHGLIGYESVTPELASTKPSLLKNPILARLDWVSDHSETIRYAPDGEPGSWEVGEPYIPKELIPDGPSNPLMIEIYWES